MALDQSALLELTEALKAGDGAQLMRTALQTMLQALIEAEATAHIGADRHERSEARTTQRNSHRDKLVTTTTGDVTVRIPMTRTGAFLPALLAPRPRIDIALHAVVTQAYVEGVSTRRVDDLVVAMGGTGIGKSEDEGEDPQVVAVDQTCFAQPACELGAAVDEDGAAVLLLDLRDVLGERRTVM